MGTALDVRVGGSEDVGAALAVYEASNLARRRGDWPSREARLKQVAANVRDPASFFVVAEDGGKTVGMALALPYREHGGAGPPVAGTVFLDLVYVMPQRWGEGIGGAVLDAMVAEASGRGASRIVLWTHEADNERAQRLYRSRAFRRTGRTASDDRGEPTAEWARDV